MASAGQGIKDAEEAPYFLSKLMASEKQKTTAAWCGKVSLWGETDFAVGERWHCQAHP